MRAYYLFLATLAAFICSHAVMSYHVTREWFYKGAIFFSAFAAVVALLLS